MARVSKSASILFLHTGWAREYRGAKSDLPQGKFGYITAGEGYAGESVNFKNLGGRCYGYAPHATIDLQRLGGKLNADHLDHVLVVFTATNPDGSGRYVIGWYDNARVYAERQETRPDPHRPDFLVEARVEDVHLVPVDERVFSIPAMKKGWPGVSSAFYASDTLTSDHLSTLNAYIAGDRLPGFILDSKRRSGSGGLPRQSHQDIKIEVEAAAITIVRHYYDSRGYEVSSVESENLGWDIEARFGCRKFLVEVKGRSNGGSVELSPNEYAAMTGEAYRMQYRLAVVHNALSSDSRLSIFQYIPGKDAWISEAGDLLSIKIRQGACISF